MGSSVAVVPVVLLAVGNSLSFVSAAPVTSLPGWDGTLPSKQDAGHITVDDTLGTSYFYCAGEHRQLSVVAACQLTSSHSDISLPSP